MAHKLDAYKQQIFEFKAVGLPVRKIAERLTESSGEKIAPSTVQHAIKTWSNGNGETCKTDLSIDASVLQGRVDSLEILVDELKAKLDLMDPDKALVYKPWGHGYVLGGFKYSTNGKTYPVVYESVWALVKHRLIRLVR